MNRSIGFRTQAASLTFGGLGRFGGDERPVRLILGPEATQRLSRSFCAAVSVLFDVGRRHDLLGVVREDPGDQLARVEVAGGDRAGLDGVVARSSRRSALRAALSGPWQAKQFSRRIGRMSRLNSTAAFDLSSARAEPVVIGDTPIARSTSAPKVNGRGHRLVLVPVWLIGALPLRQRQTQECGLVVGTLPAGRSAYEAWNSVRSDPIAAASIGIGG